MSDSRRLVISSKNVQGLEELRNLLNDFGVKSWWVKSKNIIIGIRITDRKSLERFSTSIGFIVKRKKEKLERIMCSYKKQKC